MIKGVTRVAAVQTEESFQRLTTLFSALGFEPGKGWDETVTGTGTGKGAAFLAPLANIEFVTGRLPAVPELLIEVTALDNVHAIVSKWATTETVSAAVETHWKSRIFTVELGGLHLGFWENTDPFQGQHSAIEGDLSAEGMRFGIVTARWNAVITDRLLQGSLDGLLRSGAKKADIEIVRVPGAWEVASAARTLADTKRFDAIITLGCLIRGETAHYEAIYNEVARGIGQSQQETGIPHAFGVLTCETLEQALNRAGVKAGNKGFEAAIAAIEMVSIQQKLKAGSRPGTGK